MFQYFFMDEPEEYFIGLIIGQHVSVVVATSHVATWGNQKDVVSVNSHHLTSMVASSKLIWQMCFQLPVYAPTLFIHNSKILSKLVDFIYSKSYHFHPSFPMQYSKLNKNREMEAHPMLKQLITILHIVIFGIFCVSRGNLL